ncbi:MAG: Nif3-like dinuclear metal center hexameric protein [Pirellulaceae bacterium]
MTSQSEITGFLEQFAPLHLAEDWDNVGLLIGRQDKSVARILTCLTVTPDSVTEAIEQKCDLIVSHHPIPFRPLKKLTDRDTVGQLVLSLIEAKISVFSPHTAFDSAKLGINQQWAEGLELQAIRPLVPHDPGDELGNGAGRMGEVRQPMPLSELVQRTKSLLSIKNLQIVGDPSTTVQKIAIACGAAGSFLENVKQHSCDVFILGETNFHTCLEAQAQGIQLILPGHFASERFAVEHLASILANEFGDVEVWPSAKEHDPLTWI